MISAKKVTKLPHLTVLLEFSKGSSDLMSSLPFPTRIRWKHIGEITFIGDVSTKFFLSGPHCFLLVHFVNSWFLLVHSSSSNAFFKIAKRPFEDCGEIIKFGLLVPRNLQCHNKNDTKKRERKILVLNFVIKHICLVLVRTQTSKLTWRYIRIIFMTMPTRMRVWV